MNEQKKAEEMFGQIAGKMIETMTVIVQKTSDRTP